MSKKTDIKVRPHIVCLCGSTRFAEQMNREAERQTLRGNIVVRPEVVTYSEAKDPQIHDPETKEKLDRLHLHKIDLADWVIVVCPGGYIGYSTRREIEYARDVGKLVKFTDGTGRYSGGTLEFTTGAKL